MWCGSGAGSSIGLDNNKGAQVIDLGLLLERMTGIEPAL
jgi:hypothetical protein